MYMTTVAVNLTILAYTVRDHARHTFMSRLIYSCGQNGCDVQ